MIAEAPIDVRELLKTANITLPVAHLAQLSPFFRDEAKRLLAMPRQKRNKNDADQVGSTRTHRSAEVRQLSTELINGIDRWRDKRNKKIRAFSLPAIVWKDGDKKAFSIPRNQVTADQGSDINLVYPDLQKRLGLQLLPLRQLNIPSIRITVADGTRYELQH